MRTARGLLVIALAIGALAPPARAGGWWAGIGLEDQPVGIGESISLRLSEVMFDSIEKADRAKEKTFHAYLVRDFNRDALDEAMTRADPGRWWEPMGEPVRIGSVELFRWDANIAKAQVRLEIPEIPEGRHWLMLCDAGCRRPLGNLIPSKVRVTAEVIAAQTARRSHASEEALEQAMRQLRSELQATRRSLRQQRTENGSQTETIGVLKHQVAVEREETGAESNSGAGLVAYVGWFAAGALLSLLLMGRAGRRHIKTPHERVPDDARELTKSL